MEKGKEKYTPTPAAFMDLHGKRCEDCNGYGSIGGYQRFADGEVDTIVEPCETCNGTGWAKDRSPSAPTPS